MANKRMEFLIGFMVLTVFVTVAVMTILFGTPKNLIQTGGSQKMVIVFDKAPGIGNNSRVMKSGVEIGRVYKNELIDETDHAEVRVFFKLNPGAKIYSNEYARINQTILGNAAIEFIKNPNYTGEIKECTSDESLTGVPGGDLMGTVTNMEGDLVKTIQSINGAAKELTVFIGNLNNFLGTPEELNRKKLRVENVFKELSETLITTRNLAANMNAIVGDKGVQDNIKTAASNVPEILAKVDALISNANILADDFRETISKTHQTFDKVAVNLDNMEDFTESLSENGPEFLTALNESGNRMKSMLDNISKLSADLTQQLNDSSTPLGMLGDPEIGSSMRNTIKNVEIVSEKVQPIVDDARVFSNKIAHKPSTLIWGGRSYKGIPDVAQTDYNFQTLTPSNGTYSPLYTASRPSCLQKHLGKSCFSGKADFTPRLDGSDEETMRISEITGDDAQAWEPGSVMIETPHSCCLYPAESKKKCGSKFSVGHCDFSLMKLFHKKDADSSPEIADDGEYLVDEPMIDGENWINEDEFADASFPEYNVCGPDAADCSPQCDSSAFCSAGGNNPSNAYCPESTPALLPESNSPAPMPGLDLNQETSDLEAEPLPSSVLTPEQNRYKPISGSNSGSPLPGPSAESAPVSSSLETRSSESFVDDGLPLLYMPN